PESVALIRLTRSRLTATAAPAPDAAASAASCVAANVAIFVGKNVEAFVVSTAAHVAARISCHVGSVTGPLMARAVAVDVTSAVAKRVARDLPALFAASRKSASASFNTSAPAFRKMRLNSFWTGLIAQIAAANPPAKRRTIGLGTNTIR